MERGVKLTPFSGGDFQKATDQESQATTILPVLLVSPLGQQVPLCYSFLYSFPSLSFEHHTPQLCGIQKPINPALVIPNREYLQTLQID